MNTLEQHEEAHNAVIDKIEAIMSNPMPSPIDLAEAEYLYTRARAIAYRIVGHYKAEFKHYEAEAEKMQAKGYELIRQGKSEAFAEKFKSAVDAQYMSRLSKGIQLDKAAKYEGLYDTWRGIAETYQDSANAIKDRIKAITSAGG